jgi:CBS-domain-containing membrane protein
MRVHEVMRPAALSGSPTLSLAEAAERLDDAGAPALVVLDRDRLVGIVTAWDLDGAWPSESTSLTLGEMRALLRTMTLARVMTREVLTVAPSTRLTEAGRLMLDHDLSALPVLDGDRLVGILTEADLVRGLDEIVRAAP